MSLSTQHQQVHNIFVFSFSVSFSTLKIVIYNRNFESKFVNKMSDRKWITSHNIGQFLNTTLSVYTIDNIKPIYCQHKFIDSSHYPHRDL